MKKIYIVTEPAMRFEQIAEQLGLTKPTVRSIYASAMEKLRDYPKGNLLRAFITEQPNESTNRNHSYLNCN